MKLISKEIVLNGLIDWQFTSDDEKEYATIEQMIKSIEETPTVEAIPIEWLKENYGNLQIVRYIMKDWEKENE